MNKRRSKSCTVYQEGGTFLKILSHNKCLRNQSESSRAKEGEGNYKQQKVPLKSNYFENLLKPESKG